MSVETRPQTHVECKREGNLVTVRLVPEAGPPLLTSPVLGELTRITEQLAQEACVRYVVFRGSGSTFSGGADLHEVMQMSQDQAFAFASHGQNLLNAIENLPQVTFAAMNGHAAGGGLELALACSFRIAVADAKVGLPEVRFGVIPAWGGTQRLPLLAPLNFALRMLYSGDMIDAQQALQNGIVDEVVPTADDIDGALARWFDLLSAGASQAIIRIKRAVLNSDEAHQFGLCFTSDDPKEGMRAFLEHRQPNWTIDAQCREANNT